MGRLRTTHVGETEQVFVDFLGILLFFSGAFTLGEALVIEGRSLFVWEARCERRG